MTTRRALLPWFVWGIGILSYAVAVINRSSLAALGPAAQHHFNVDATGLAIFVFVQLLVYGALQIPVGLLMTRFGIHPVMIIGLALMSIGQVCMALAPEVWIAVLARVLVGAGDAGIFICAIRLIANWFPPKYLPVVSQITGLSGHAGQLVSVTPLALLVNAAGWHSGFFTLAGVSGVMCVGAIAVLRDKPGQRTAFERITGWTSKTTRNAAPLAHDTLAAAPASPITEALPVLGPGGTGVFTALGQLLRRPGVRLAFWIHFTTPFALHAFLLLWGTPFLTGGMGLTRAESGLVLSVSILATMSAGLSLGPITSRWSQHRVVIALGIMAVIISAWTVTLLWPGQAPLWWLLVLGFIQGWGGPTSMIAFDVVRSHAHEHQASLATGFVNTGGFLAAIIAIFCIGVALDLQGAGSPDTYAATPFKTAMAVQYPLWILGCAMMLRELPRARAAVARRQARS